VGKSLDVLDVRRLGVSGGAEGKLARLAGDKKFLWQL
jgi:hypothetical protein